MLAIVAVHAQQFPVAAVGRIIIVVAVFVVHRQLVQFLTGKFPAAPRAYPGQYLERSIAVKIAPAHAHLPRLRENVLQLAVIRSGLLCCHCWKFMTAHDLQQDCPKLLRRLRQ